MMNINDGTATIPMVQEAFKAHTRGEYLSAIKTVRKKLFSHFRQLEASETEAAAAFSDSPTLTNFCQLTDTRRAFTYYQGHSELKSLAGRIFESGDKNGKLLANLMAEFKSQTVVSKIGCTDRRTTSDPNDVLNEFSSYYSNLNRALPGGSVTALWEHLSALNLPTLLTADFESLDKDFTVEEVETAIRSFPSPDGLPGESYRMYASLIAPDS